jgi:hypothetical protein
LTPTFRRIALPLAAASLLSVVLAACGPAARTPRRPAAEGALVAEARPIGRGGSFRPPAPGLAAGRCSRRLEPRVGVHLELFAANRVVVVAAGIGTRTPRRVTLGRISAARCYGDLVTLEPTGVVLLRPGLRLPLGALFDAWGQPLSERRLGPFRARAGSRVAVFLNGRRWHGSPNAVPLRAHSEIVLEVGLHVPPHASYTFPPGI